MNWTFWPRIGWGMSLGGLLAMGGVFSCSAAVLGPTSVPATTLTDRSFAQEIEHAIDRGLAFLQSQQNSNGYWSLPEQPAMTALAVMAFQGEPRQRYRAPEPEWLARAYAYLLSCAQPDGGLHRTNLVTYNTSLCMMALLGAEKPEYDPIIRKARQFLVRLQTDFGERGKTDNVFDGGIGYGSHYDHSDMGNTLQALEAIYLSRRLAEDKAMADARDLNWQAAIQFLQNCQNLPSHNSQEWVSQDPKEKGGFVYYPGHSMAGGITNAQGKVALRSYGSISYGGLLSYIYAELKRDDPRVVAVYDWLRKNYTLTENPGMGPQGLYYYYHTQAKALQAFGVRELDLATGQKVNWRRELATRLLNLQQTNGSWFNTDHARWWEKDPVLVTAYAVLTLNIVHRGI